MGELNELTHSVIGAAIAVHRELGPGYPESVYEEAMGVELDYRGVRFSRQVVIEVGYRGRKVGEGRVDMLVEGQLIVEYKAAEKIVPLYVSQVVSYLKALDRRLGLLINFNVPRLRDGVKRVIFP